MKFSYCDDGADKILTLTGRHFPVSVYFESGNPYVIWAAGREFDPNDDDILGFHIESKGKIYSLYQIMHEAQDQFEELDNEARLEEAADAAMYQELSSVEATGRI